MKTIAFFNNKGGVGKTSLVYHLSWMYAELGLNIIAADLDPQSNLTSMFLDEDRLIELWPEGEHPSTIFGSLQPRLKTIGDIKDPHLENISERIGLVVGDLGLSLFEDNLSEDWPKCLDRKESAFRTISAFYRILHIAAEKRETELVLIDVGPNLGAVNRSAIIAADYVVIPLAPDLYSLQGLRNLGPTLRQWRSDWKERLKKNPDPNIILPKGNMQPIGYVVLQHAVRVDRPVKAYDKWITRMPSEYRKSVLDIKEDKFDSITDDPYCLSLLRHYRSLMPMAMEVRKPMFFLKPADGAIGAHVKAVEQCYQDFKDLALKIKSLVDE